MILTRNQKRVSIALAVLLLINMGLMIFNGSLLGKRRHQKEDFPQKYQIVSPELPEEISFAGERVPLEINDVRERLDREIVINTYLHAGTILNIKRANRWLPSIEKILKENGIPEDFKYVAIIESGLENAISPRKAVGFWQFTEDAALQFGLEVSPQVDERYHAEKSTYAAIRYLKQAHARFGNWTIAAASYNMGMGGINNQMTRQRIRNYYDLHLNEETSRYIFRALAMKVILSEPRKYGFSIDRSDMYDPYNAVEVSVDSSIPDLPGFAFARGTNYKVLKILNPWLRDISLTNKARRQYVIKLPR